MFANTLRTSRGLSMPMAKVSFATFSVNNLQLKRKHLTHDIMSSYYVSDVH